METPAPQHEPQPQPATEATTTTTPANPTATPAQSQNVPLRARLDAAEQHWLWKYSLRAILLVTSIIGIGCIAWAVAHSNDSDYEELDDQWSIPWALITFGLSFIWCAVCILVLLLRRPNAPVHPGVAVGLDLVLWLAFIPTAMFALIGVLSVMDFGSGGIIDDYSGSGYYLQAPNGTWVWNQTSYDSFQSPDRNCNQSYYEYSYFSSCAEEDAFINNLWKSKGHRVGVEMTGVVCQFIGLVLHCALFIWACVDTHRRNSTKVSKDAEKLAASIVQNMIQSGAVVPAQGHMQQPLLHGQHAAPMGYAPGPMPVMPPQAVVAGPEKGESSRFA